MTAPLYSESHNLYMSSYTLKQLLEEFTDFAIQHNVNPDLVTLYFGSGEESAWLHLLRPETKKEKEQREAKEQREKKKIKLSKEAKLKKERALYEKLKAKFETRSSPHFMDGK